MALQASYRQGWKTDSRSNRHLSKFWTPHERRRNRNRVILLRGAAGGPPEKPVSENPVSQDLAYTSAMKRIALSALALFLVTAHAATVKVQLRIPSRQYEASEQILATVDNLGTQPITICIDAGHWSLNMGKVESTPIPFWFERKIGQQWGILIGSDLPSVVVPEVVEAGKSLEFPFRLSDKGTMRLRLNYWPGARPDLNCTPPPRGAKQLVSPTFVIG
jgi:hypothetical protein